MKPDLQRWRYFNFTFDEEDKLEVQLISKVAGSNSQLMSSLDIDEDGRLEILLQSVNEQGVPQLQVVYNNFVIDKFFLKMMMFSDDRAQALDKYTYNTNIEVNNLALMAEQKLSVTYGATFRFVTTSLDDEKIVEVGSLLPQSSYTSLIPPYVHVGVGRSNNYIESFNTGLSIQGKFDEIVKTPIVPNSQLIIVYQYDELLEKGNWDVSLVIMPDENMYLIMICCAFLLVILGVSIMILHYQERREDQQKRPQMPQF
mmetsp:Transcript_9006/g.15239  ORF Transcript_9006/g.15239 Transcript_9006/m.15239 type:complete len:257 (-) Transcript_9006:6-776(-)